MLGDLIFARFAHKNPNWQKVYATETPSIATELYRDGRRASTIIHDAPYPKATPRSFKPILPKLPPPITSGSK